VVNASEAQSLLGACILLLTNILRISKGGLVITRATTSGLEARLGPSSREASTSGKIILSWLGAVKAALLAPSKEARRLAVLESISGSCIIALAAGRRDAEIRLNTRRELVVVNASEAQSLLGACVLLLTNILRIRKGGLVIRGATTCGLEAGSRRTSWNASAIWQGRLCRSSAVKAALFAPSEEASSLAILEAIISSDGIAFAAIA